MTTVAPDPAGAAHGPPPHPATGTTGGASIVRGDGLGAVLSRGTSSSRTGTTAPDTAPRERTGRPAPIEPSPDRYRLLAENAADVLVVLDADDRVTWASPASRRMLGVEPAALLGDVRWERIHPDDAAVASEAIARLRRADIDVASIRIRMRQQHGPFRWWRAVARCLSDDVAASDLVVALHDIDDAVRAAEHAQREHTRFVAAMGSMLDPFVQLDAVRGRFGGGTDLVVVEVNAAACAAMREEHDALVRQRVLRRFPRLAQTEYWQALIDVVESGEPFVRDGVLLPVDDTTTVYVDLRAVRTADGVSVTWRDVTDRVMSEQALVESERRYRVLAESMHDVVFVVDAETLRFKYISPSVESQSGFTPAELMALRLDTVVSSGAESVLDMIAGGLVALREGRAEFDRFLTSEQTVQRRNGDTVRLETIGKYHRDEQTGRVEIWGVSRDVTARYEAEQALAASEERYRLLAEYTSDVVAMVGPGGRVQWVSPSAIRTLRWEPEDLVGTADIDMVHPDDAEWFGERVAELAVSRAPGMLTFRMRRGDGTFVWVEAASEVVPATATRPELRVVRLRDVDAQVHAIERLRFLATHDPLTELANRGELVRCVERLLTSPRTGTRLGLLFIDLDGLKTVNDAYGHETGDVVIQHVAARLRSCLRGDDLVSRFGGDEFVAVLPAVHSIDDVVSIAGTLHQALVAPVQVGSQLVPITISIGAAVADAGEEPDDVLRRADAALYRAKAAGRARTETA